MQDNAYKWLLGLTLHAFERDEKTFSIRIDQNKADVFLGQFVNDTSQSILTISRDNAIQCLKDTLELGNMPVNDNILKGGFICGAIKRYAIGKWGYNFGILSQGATNDTIITITATMTDDEVKAVQKMAKENHYELEDVFERAFDEDIQAEVDEQLNTDTLREAIAKAQQSTKPNPYS